MAVRPRSEEEGDEYNDGDDNDVECDVCVGTEADRIKGEKEECAEAGRTQQADAGGSRGPYFRIGTVVLIASKRRGRT